MLVKYQYRCDAEYFRAVIDRQYRQGPWLLRLPIQFGILGLVFASVFAATIRASMVGRAESFIVIFGLVFVIGAWGTRHSLMRKFRRKPDFGSEVEVSLSDAGVEVDSNSSSTLEWSTYPSAIRFVDGILLKTIRWLPDAAITAGSAEKATSLTSSKTLLRYVY